MTEERSSATVFGMALRELVWLGVLFVLAAGVLGLTLMSLAAKPYWQTGARVVAWTGMEGQRLEQSRDDELYPWTGCQANDIGFEALHFKGALWTPCGHPEAFPHGAYARVDPERAAGEVLWPIPEDLERKWTIALFPNEDNGLVGVVYETRDDERDKSQFVLGVMGPKGWQIKPFKLPSATLGGYMGGAWVDGALEIALVTMRDGASRSDSPKAPLEVLFVRVLEDGSTEIRNPFGEVEGGLCSVFGESFCYPRVAFRRDGQWRVFVDAMVRDDANRAWEVTEAGQRSANTWGLDTFILTEMLDTTAFGRLRLPTFMVTGSDKKMGRLTRQGTLEPYKAPSREGWQFRSTWPRFEVHDGALRHAPVWVIEGERFGIGYGVGERFVAVYSSYDDPDNAMRFADVTDANAPRWSVPVRAPSYACGSLNTGMFVPAAQEGAHWLVDRRGCYIKLSEDFERLDPLGVVEHLRRRGSLGMDWDEHSHFVKLLFLLFGLPLGVSVAGVVVRRKMRAAEAAKRGELIFYGLCWSVGLYVLIGAVCLYQLLPLLR